MSDVVRTAAQILQVAHPEADWSISHRCGARTCGIVANRRGVAHRWSHAHEQVVVKLYKGAGNPAAASMYLEYHGELFPRLDVLKGNLRIQQSLEAGMWAGNTPYAVLTYVPGDELKDLLEVGITPERGAAILEEIFCAILVPVWQAGLRFKDFHPGNFIVQQDGTVVMIDTEQIRKDAKEMLATPNDWTQRNRHADQGLRRIPKLIERVVLASGSPTAAGKMNQNIRSKMDELHLYDRLNALGKGAVGENAQTLCEDIRKIIRNFF